ncbi:MAG TPA: MFS transporter [Burkholderiales bacterium]|nr:MFS transporter [Burkholderiales bacterium]
MTLYRIAFLTILLHLAFAGMRVTQSLFALHLGASAATVGVLMSLLAIVPVLFAVRWGRYIDRVGVRGPMYTGAAAILFALTLACAVPRLETLFVVSAFAGSGFMYFHIAVNQAAGLIGVPAERARNFSVLALAFSVSSFLGPMSAGFAIDFVGYTWTFALFAGAVVLMIALLSVWKIEVRRHEPHAHAGGRKHVVDLLRVPTLRRVLVVSGLLSMGWDLFSFVMPIHGRELGLSASTIGLILGAFGAAVFVVRLVMPPIVHRLSEWKMLIGAMLVTGIGLAALPLVRDVTLLVALSFVIGMGLGGAQPMVMALLYNTSPPGRAGEAVGVRTFLLNISQAGMPLMFGAAGAALGMAPVFWTMAGALIAGGWYAGRRR